MEICARVYRPRRPREPPLFRLVEQHIEEFLRVYPERFAKQHGPLRPVVERVLREFVKCGDVAHGFARARCETCRLSYLIPYSCRGRSFCPSCEKKRSILWAEWLREEVLEPVPHRHVVLTMPRLLRPLFRRRRELLLDLSQCGAEALSEHMRREVGADTQPGIVVPVATSGDLLQWHPHLHVLVTDGAFSDDGTFHHLATWDGEAALMRPYALLGTFQYISPEQLEVYVTNYPAATAKWQVSNEGGSRPSWSAAGKQLYYLAGDRLVAAATFSSLSHYRITARLGAERHGRGVSRDRRSTGHELPSGLEWRAEACPWVA